MNQYLDFYHLKEDPFRLTPDPDYYYPSREHVHALLSLEYCMEHREGFCCLTGEPGTGKTTLLRIFLSTWQDKAEIALIMTPRLSPEEFLRAVLDDLSVPLERAGKNEMLKSFRDFLIRHAATGRNVAIIVDEAQNLPDDTLEELRLLSNLETNKEKLLQIILIGQPELADRLQSDRFKQLNQRITVRATLTPLSVSSTVDYVKTRLIKAGNSGSLFDDGALRHLQLLSGGIPRIINTVASRTLMAGFLQGTQQLGMKEVELAGAEVHEHLTPGPGSLYRFIPQALRQVALVDVAIAVAIAAVVLICSAGIWREFHH